MAHEISYPEPDRARIKLDLQEGSYDPDYDAPVAQYVTLKNTLVGRPGPLKKRGAFESPASTGGNALISVSSTTKNSLRTYRGRSKGGTYLPYLFGGRVVVTHARHWGVQHETSAGTSIAPALSTMDPPRGAAAMVGDDLMWASLDQNSLPGIVGSYGGSVGPTSAYTTGTVTIANGSPTITGSGTTFAASMVGAYIKVATGTATEVFYYRIKSVDSATQLTLEKNLVTASAGASKTYAIYGIVPLTVTAGVIDVTTTPSTVYAGAACSAWGRLFLFDVYDSLASATKPTSDDATRRKYRGRWTGLVNRTDEGTAPYTGVNAMHAQGYIDFDTNGGAGLAAIPHGSDVLAFQERILTVMRGAPTFSNTGSLDISEQYPAALVAPEAVVSTPHGVFFVDRDRGLMLWDGGQPKEFESQRLGLFMTTSGPFDEVAYYDEHVLMAASSNLIVIHIPSRRISLWTNYPSTSGGMTPGRNTFSRVEALMALEVSLADKYVIDMGNCFDNPGDAATDRDGTTILADIKTGKIGDPRMRLRVVSLWITYRLTDLTSANPRLQATITTGLPDSPDADHTFTTVSTDLVETTNVETAEIRVNMMADQMLQLRILQVNGAGKCEIHSVVLDCDVEGEASSR